MSGERSLCWTKKFTSSSAATFSAYFMWRDTNVARRSRAVQSRAELATVITRSDAPPTRCNSPRRRVATLRQDSDDTTSSALCGHDRRPPTAIHPSSLFRFLPPSPPSLPRSLPATCFHCLTPRRLEQVRPRALEKTLRLCGWAGPYCRPHTATTDGTYT